MKILIALQILVASGQKALKSRMFDAEDCSTVFEAGGGYVDLDNDDLGGEVTLEGEPRGTYCKLVVDADPDCTEIKIHYRDVAVAKNRYTCRSSFWFEWYDTRCSSKAPPPFLRLWDSTKVPFESLWSGLSSHNVIG